MFRHLCHAFVCAVLLCAIGAGTASAVTPGEKIKLSGLIVGRAGESLTLRTAEEGDVQVALTPNTKVSMPKGLFKARHQDTAVTALVPGLRIKVKGIGNLEGNQVIADSISFSKNDLQTAQQIQAGLVPTQQQVQLNRNDIDQNRENILANQQQIGEQGRQIEANQQDITEVNQRFSALTDYDVKFTDSVYFAVGSSAISDKDKNDLLQLAINARNLKGYLVQVEGFCDSSGDPARNQQLSMERAQAVIAYLAQNGNIPLLHILAPGAMGTSNPVASNETPQGRSENRRVQVKVLVNRGLSAP